MVRLFQKEHTIYIRRLCMHILSAILLGLLLFPATETEATSSAPKLNMTEVSLAVGKSTELSVTGADAVTWSSANKGIAEVDSAGKVTAIAGGNTTITATADGKKLKCRIWVKELRIKNTSVVLIKGNSYSLGLAMTNLTGEASWKSSNKKVAAVNRSGKVSAKEKGTATVTASVDGCTASCKIRVINAQLSASKLSLVKGKNKTLVVTGTSRTVTWSSSDPSVASVSNTGTVTANKKGTAAITASIGKGSLTCKVTVSNTVWTKLLNRYRSQPKTKQLLFVKYTGGSSAKVLLYNKENQKWVKILTCSGEVGRDGIGQAREGIPVTPTGTYTLTGAFGIQPDPGASQTYLQVNSNHYWCADEAYYNQLIDITEKPHSCTGEHLIEYTQCYAYGMFFDYNKECVYKAGSAFFLHCKGDSGYTMGCIAVSRANMVKILKNVEEGGKICIYNK